MKLLKFLLVYFLISLSTLSYSQSSSDEIFEKRAAYDAAIDKIRDLEEKANYGGEDPIIRERLNLPPRLPSFEEWISQNENKKISTEDQPIVPSPSSATESRENTSPSVEKKIVETIFPWTEAEKMYILITIFSVLIVNFIIYSVIVSGRVFFISTPFDIGARGQKSNLENSVKWKKYLIELFLLLILMLLIPFVLNEGKQSSSEDIMGAVVFGLKAYAGLHVGYVVVRWLWGSSSRCPKCGTPFAAVHQNSWEESKLTYQKNMSGKLFTFEKGVRHSNYSCRGCGHGWEKHAQYEKQLTY